MQSTLNNWSPTSTATPRLAEKLIELYRKEGLEGFLDVPYGFATLAYNAVGEIGRAVKYADLAIEAIEMKDEAWTRNMDIWREVRRDPRGHWSYMRRVR